MRSVMCAFIGVMVLAGAALGQDEFQVKRFYLTVLIVEGGQARANIVAPDDEEYQELAREVQAGIKDASGAELAIVPPGAALPEAWTEGKSFILLGKLGDNAAVDALYRQHYVCADAQYPGEGGYVVRTIHDPYGTGACAVLLGGSDLEGVGRAVEEFLALLPQGDTVSLPHTIKVEGPAIPAPITPEQADGIIARLAKSNFRSVGSRASSGCLNYHRTGDPEQARVARAALYRLAEIVAKMDRIGDTRGVVYLPTIFDLVEENSVWTDEDREKLGRFMYEFAQKAPYADSEIEPSSVPAGNNWNIRTSWAAARYFQKHYGMDVKGLVGKVDQYFENMMTWKSREDCPGYGSMTVIDILHYVLKKPDFEYFESGLARQMAEYEMTVTNNLGAVAGFGDISSHSSSAHCPGAMAVLAWYYRDGRYLWALEKMSNPSPGSEFLGNAYALSDLEPVEPTDLLGVHVLPLESWVYDNRDDVLGTGVPTTDELLRAGEDPPFEKCFDKISFRNGFDERDQYLLLGGQSHGYHSHPDGNSIIAYTDEGLLWIFDNGYFVPDTVEQNTIAVYRDGLFEPVPRLTSLDAHADFATVGMTQTSVAAYNGMDWRRNLIWAKEQYFVVIDELTAREAGDYGCQCIFRVIGEPETKLKGEREEVPDDWQLLRQGTARFVLRTDGHPTWSFHGVTPPAAGRHGIFENQNAELEAGESLSFQSIFYCPTGEDDFSYEIVRAVPTAALVSGPDGFACVGAGELAVEGLPQIEATLFHVTPQLFSLADGRSLAWPEPLFQCDDDKAVSLYLDLAAGSGMIVADEEVTVRIPAVCAENLTVDGKAYPAQEQGGLIPIKLAAGEHELSFAPQAAAGQRAGTLQTAFTGFRHDKEQMLAARAEQTAEMVDAVFSYEFEREETVEVFVALDDEAELTNLARVGKAMYWTEAQAGCGPRNATDENLETYSAVSSGAAHTTNLPKDLGVEWGAPQTVGQAWFWHYSLQYVPAEDGHDLQYWDGEDWVSIDDQLEQLDDGATWVHTFEPVTTTRLRLFVTGFAQSRTAIREMRMFERPAERKDVIKEYLEPVHALTAADLTGDGSDEVIACIGNEVRVLNEEGEAPWAPSIVWQAPIGEGHGKCIDTYDLDGDGRLEVIVGGSDHKVHVFDAEGNPVWTADCPSDAFQPEREPMTGTIDVIAADDINQDGKGEVVFGSANWFAYALDHAGNLLWSALNWAHPPLDIVLHDVTGDGNLEALIATRYNSANLFTHEGKRIDAVSAGYHGIPMSVAAGDLDGNGKVEMVIGSRVGGVHCKEHGGERAWSLNLGSKVSDVAVADLNGDGMLEVLACSGNNYIICTDADGGLVWRRNVGGAAREMVVADVDGDGSLEIVVSVGHDSPVLLSGDGELLRRVPTMGTAEHIAVADVTGDGRPELIVGRAGAVCAVRF